VPLAEKHITAVTVSPRSADVKMPTCRFTGEMPNVAGSKTNVV